MFRLLNTLTLGLLTLLASTSAIAQSEPINNSLIARLSTGVIETVVYSAIGIVMAVVGFKVVDWLTPGDLADEVARKENRALAILAGSMMLGVCIIIASALID